MTTTLRLGLLVAGVLVAAPAHADGPWWDALARCLGRQCRCQETPRCCPDDYRPKSMPCTRPLPCGFCDDYCCKPLPCPPRPAPCGCTDDYVCKPCPIYLGPVCSPYLTCGPTSRCGSPK